MTLCVLFVCMGNICRSPTAQGVMRQKLRAAGCQQQVRVDSAGTHGWHAGAPPDERAQAHARARGYEIGGLRARALVDADFARADLLLVMDDDNLAEVVERCPAVHRQKLGLLAAYCTRNDVRGIPDPYHGGATAFERTLDLIEDACDGLLAQLAPRLHAAPPAVRNRC